MLVEDNPQAPDDVKATNVPQDLCALTSQHRAIQDPTNIGNLQVMFSPDGILFWPAVPGTIKYIFENDGAMSFTV